jgi:hypothetical protein
LDIESLHIPEAITSGETTYKRTPRSALDRDVAQSTVMCPLDLSQQLVEVSERYLETRRKKRFTRNAYSVAQVLTDGHRVHIVVKVPKQSTVELSKAVPRPAVGEVDEMDKQALLRYIHQGERVWYSKRVPDLFPDSQLAVADWGKNEECFKIVCQRQRVVGVRLIDFHSLAQARSWRCRGPERNRGSETE